MGLGPKAHFATGNTSASVRLSGWKEIAVYLDRDPRTVQLWEKFERLPVHRLTHRARASVYAYTDEIDLWMQARSGDGAIGVSLTMKRAIRRAFFPRLRSWAAYLLAAMVMLALLSTFLWAATHHKRLAPAAPARVLVVPRSAN